MTVSGPLAGKTVVVTRPRAQAQELVEAIAAAGGRALLFPLLDIQPAADPAALRAALSRLEDYRFAVFISPNAVEYAWPAIGERGWPASLSAVAVGQGTVRALARHGVAPCIAPTERFDSEALLDLPELAAERVAGQGVLILRGDGGRELLADTLRERGARVDCVTCYRRAGPPEDIALLLAAWRAGRLDALTVSSSEGLRHLVDRLDAEGREFLRRTPLFVPHARIADNARALGLERIILTLPADAGIMAGLGAYNWAA